MEEEKVVYCVMAKWRWPGMAEGTKNPARFLRDVGKELKRVSWPNRKELTKYTIVVIITIIFFVVFFGVVDLLLSELVRIFLD